MQELHLSPFFRVKIWQQRRLRAKFQPGRRGSWRGEGIRSRKMRVRFHGLLRSTGRRGWTIQFTSHPLRGASIRHFLCFSPPLLARQFSPLNFRPTPFNFPSLHPSSHRRKSSKNPRPTPRETGVINPVRGRVSLNVSNQNKASPGRIPRFSETKTWTFPLRLRSEFSQP